jgi:DNA-binding IclR family transcriptional regulator
MASSQTSIHSVSHAIHILELFQTGQALGLSEISRGAGIPRATSHRILTTLVQHELLVRTPERKYRLSLRLFELGSRALAIPTLQQAVYPFLVTLVQQTQETAHFAVLDGEQVGYVAKVESPHPIRMYAQIGWRGPLHATALGKVLLAFSEAAFRQRVLGLPLTAYTAHTLVERDQLEEELQRIRVAGYAMDREELLEGLVCLAVPVMDQTTVYGAISLAGPKGRMAVLPLHETVALLQQQSAQFRAHLAQGTSLEKKTSRSGQK